MCMTAGSKSLVVADEEMRAQKMGQRVAFADRKCMVRTGRWLPTSSRRQLAEGRTIGNWIGV